MWSMVGWICGCRTADAEAPGIRDTVCTEGGLYILPGFYIVRRVGAPDPALFKGQLYTLIMFYFSNPYVVVSKFSSVTCRSLLDSRVLREYSVHGWTGHILWPLGQAQGLACRGSTFLAWDSGFGINAIVACLCWGISLPSHPSCSFVMAARPSVAASQGPAFFQCFLPLPSHYNMCPTLASPTELWVP